MKEKMLVPPASDKPRYALLDGLRGVGALIVIFFHFGEAFATSPLDQMVNHGYLAVDFFWVLSGFVIGYAYDSRWKKGMTAGRFMVRRIIRLHPMVILAAVYGLIAWLVQGSVRWDGTQMPFYAALTALLLGLLMIPVIPGTMADVRGNAEMFPLNGPQWSLFFEYIGSIFYALFLHRLSTRQLRVWVTVTGLGMILCTLANFSGGYTMGYGWSILGYDVIPWGGFIGGFLQMSFCFGIGLLMTRSFKSRRPVRGAFWICGVLLTVLCALPYVSLSGETTPLNGVYDLVVTLVVLPTIVWFGARGVTSDRFSTSVCEGLGRLSYPVYIVHYPLMYLFYSWVWTNHITFTQALPAMGCILVAIPLIAWAALKFYDEPVRRWLTNRWLGAKKTAK